MNFRLSSDSDPGEVLEVSKPHPYTLFPSKAEQHVLGQRIYSLRTQSRPKTPKHAAEGGVVRGKREIVSHMVYIHHCKRPLADILLPHYGISY